MSGEELARYFETSGELLRRRLAEKMRQVQRQNMREDFDYPQGVPVRTYTLDEIMRAIALQTYSTRKTESPE